MHAKWSYEQKVIAGQTCAHDVENLGLRRKYTLRNWTGSCGTERSGSGAGRLDDRVGGSDPPSGGSGDDYSGELLPATRRRRGEAGGGRQGGEADPGAPVRIWPEEIRRRRAPDEGVRGDRRRRADGGKATGAGGIRGDDAGAGPRGPGGRRGAPRRRTGGGGASEWVAAGGGRRRGGKALGPGRRTGQAAEIRACGRAAALTRAGRAPRGLGGPAAVTLPDANGLGRRLDMSGAAEMRPVARREWCYGFNREFGGEGLIYR
nr:translation initiation factor IF-2-like [Aegilops tauschii subsp. strangulata]